MNIHQSIKHSISIFLFIALALGFMQHANASYQQKVEGVYRAAATEINGFPYSIIPAIDPSFPETCWCFVWDIKKDGELSLIVTNIVNDLGGRTYVGRWNKVSTEVADGIIIISVDFKVMNVTMDKTGRILPTFTDDSNFEYVTGNMKISFDINSPESKPNIDIELASQWRDIDDNVIPSPSYLPDGFARVKLSGVKEIE